MSAPQTLPPEVSLIYRLRQNHTTRLYSDLLDAFHLARSIMPDGTLEDLERIASYILQKSSAIQIAEAGAQESRAV